MLTQHFTIVKIWLQITAEMRISSHHLLSLLLHGFLLPLTPIPSSGYLEVPARISPVSDNMWNNNQSSQDDFILLGFSDHPWLETPLFVIFLVAYIFALFGNIAIILISRLDPQLDNPMYFFVSNLSLLDLCYTTSTVPQMVVNLRGKDKTIS